MSRLWCAFEIIKEIFRISSYKPGISINGVHWKRPKDQLGIGLTKQIYIYISRCSIYKTSRVW